MRKLAFFLLAILPLVACKGGSGGGGGNESTNPEFPDDDTHLSKPITGIDPMFHEDLGFINDSPSAFLTSDSAGYLYYRRNAKKFNLESDTIAVRTLKKVDGAWVTSETFKTVLSLPSTEGAWDGKSLGAPDVIQGKFNYQGTEYKYLMAYHGYNNLDGYNGQIGFAVSNSPDGQFTRVGAEPIVKYDPNLWAKDSLQRYRGSLQPSLMSYDRKGKIRLIYTCYGPKNTNYCLEMDCSNLDSIIRSGRMAAEIRGLSDQRTNTTLYGSDWAYDPAHEEFVAVRNFSSDVQGLPAVADGVQIVHAPTGILYDIDYTQDDADPETRPTVWDLCNDSYYKIGAIKTSDEMSTDRSKWQGYSRIYDATVFANQYGWMTATDKVEIAFTSQVTDQSTLLTGEQWKFSQMVHHYEIPYTNVANS